VVSSFHPVVARWFAESFGEPTAAQARGWDAVRKGRHTLIAAPTGSGKTLAAFLTALDDLVREADAAPFPDEVRVVYVSPLKALSADIHKNLAEPRRGIRRVAEAMGVEPPRITAAVRTGDTTQAERASMLRTPPHILVTTPESLYLLLTAEKSRAMLRTVRTVIVDEIHAVIGTRRGAHLAMSLERLQSAAEQPFLRIGLSATQKPIEAVARYLVGTGDSGVGAGLPDCAVVDEGHRRALDVAIEVPQSPLEAVMAHEVWAEYYDRLAALIAEHKTTLVFVNTRRMAERVARHLSERIGTDPSTGSGQALVMPHHGSLSKEKRLDAETRLKAGALRALVATASLELGIDIGSIDLVCQIGSPHRIATALQRIGRSGHSIAGTPKGRLFPETRDDLVECVALLRSVHRGELDAIVEYDAPIDVLTQQVVAEACARDCDEDELYALVRRAWPYRSLARESFDAVLTMATEGFATRRGRRGALLHRDEVNHRVRGRRSARLLALSSGGAIPDVADYRVVLEPEETFIGTVNEDFAIESLAGDIFQLGNLSWRIVQVAAGTVRVADAHGAPPNIPFWLGEAPARSDELSKAVSDLRADVEAALKGCLTDTTDAVAPGDPVAQAFRPSADFLIADTGVSRAVAEQVVAYFADARRALGVLPTQDTFVLERFFDESGGMQLVLHAPLGSRINKAWGLALRKRFCRQFNFELQAAATEDALLLSLGPQHSFPLADVFRYLHPATARDVLVQAFLDAPVFQTRWRWNTTIALAVPRSRGGKRLAPQLQRMMADDLMAAAFPDAAACLENIPGDRQIPDHPLVTQTVRDCLEEAMDFPALASVLERIHRGDIRCVARDTPEPSPLAHEILNARPYAFLDDAPAEERRTRAVYTRRATEPATAGDMGALDHAAIVRVRDEQRVDARDADELHDALMTVGILTEDEAPADLVRELIAACRASCFAAHPSTSSGRAEGDATAHPERVGGFTAHPEPVGGPTARPEPVGGSTACPEPVGGPAARPEPVGGPAARPEPVGGPTARPEPVGGPTARPEPVGGPTARPEPVGGPTARPEPVGGPTARPEPVEGRAIVAAERIPALRAIHPDLILDPPIEPPASRLARTWTRADALVELVRGRLTITGPTTADAIAVTLGVTSIDVDAALLTLEADGVVMRGRFTEAASSAAQGSSPAVVEWCDRTLLARIHRYTLNRLRAEIEPVCQADFMRFLFAWQHVDASHRLAGVEGLRAIVEQLDGVEVAAEAWERCVLPSRVDGYEPALLDVLCLTGEVGWLRRTASDAAELSGATPIALFMRGSDAGLKACATDAALATGAATSESVAQGFGPAAARVLAALRERGPSFAHELARACGLTDEEIKLALGRLAAAGLATSDGFGGLRWLLRGSNHRSPRTQVAGRWSAVASTVVGGDATGVDACARTLLARYGIVCRRLLARESNVPAWRDLVTVFRRLEARGEIRGGRFVSGLSGEQFARADAVERLREIRRTHADGRLTTISAADPLNLNGILTAGERVRSSAAARIVYRDGVAVAALEGDHLRPLTEIAPEEAAGIASALTGRAMPPIVSGFVGR